MNYDSAAMFTSSAPPQYHYDVPQVQSYQNVHKEPLVSFHIIDYIEHDNFQVSSQPQNEPLVPSNESKKAPLHHLISRAEFKMLKPLINTDVRLKPVQIINVPSAVAGQKKEPLKKPTYSNYHERLRDQLLGLRRPSFKPQRIQRNSC